MTGDPGQDFSRRVARNAGVRAAAELIGKFSTLALMAVLARSEGPAGLGVFVFALAWSELATTPVDMGFDRHLLRLIAKDRAAIDDGFHNVLALKLARAVPGVALSWGLLFVVESDPETRAAVCLLTVTLLIESIRHTLFATFNGLERGDLVGSVLVSQRLLSGGLGLVALALGLGVVGVAAAYVAAASAAVALGTVLLARHIGLPRRHYPREIRKRLNKMSLPFAIQELVSAGIARLDALLLAALATSAVVGLYGAAYRLLEATLFISTALLGAFSAMYTYLDEESSPTIRTAFGRSLKLSFVLLVPLAVPLAVLPAPILEMFFGESFRTGADALRVLAPTVVILGAVMLAVSLVASRLNPRILVRSFFFAFVVNLAANLALIPAMGAMGAAVAMLITEIVLFVILLRIAFRAVGAPPLVHTVAGGVVAGSAMAAALAGVDAVAPLAAALAAGGVAYAAVLVAVERLVAPDDLAHVRGMVAGRLGRRRVPAA